MMNEPFNQELYDTRLSYYKDELNRIGFTNTEFGNSIIDYLSFLQKSTNCNGFAINKFQEIVKRLLDGMPMSPITEDDFYFDEITQSRKSKRYEWAVELNGEFYDTHAIAYVNPDGSEGYREDGAYRSTKQITLPYYPIRKYVYLNEHEPQ
jgi:hypothetical protein